MNNRAFLVLSKLNVWYTLGKPVLDNFSMELGAKYELIARRI